MRRGLFVQRMGGEILRMRVPAAPAGTVISNVSDAVME